MLTQLTALIERLIPRLVSAGLVFALAYFTSPAAVGIYSAALLGYTAVQAVTESAVRQVLPQAVQETKGFLSRYRFWVSLCAPVTLLTLIAALAATGNTDAWALVLLAAAPLASTWGIASVGRLQLDGRWNLLARNQFMAALLSTCVSIPMLVAFHTIGAAAAQLVLTEVLNSWLCRRSAKRATALATTANRPTFDVGRTYRSMVWYSGLAWCQGQFDRVAIGLLSGAAVLGSFSVATALARSIGDPLAASTANVLRGRLASKADLTKRDIREIAFHVAVRALMLSVLSAVVAVALSVIARTFLNAEWAPALSMTPILALSCVPSALNWSGSVLQVINGRPTRALAAPITGILFAPLVALAAAFIGLEVAAWVVLARELAVLSVSYAILGRLAPWKAYGICLGITGVLASALAVPFVRSALGLG